jgi:transposase
VIASRLRFGRRMLRWPFRKLVFVDESGVNLSLTRSEGRAPRGERVVDHVPGSRWESYSVIAGLRSSGIIAPMMLRGAMNTEALLVWVRDVLAPDLRPGDIVIWDNLRIHTDPDVAAVIAKRRARLEFLPPYSPDLNPIEEAWSKMKSILRAAKARVADALVQALDDALTAVSPDDCRGWFKHAGYAAM